MIRILIYTPIAIIVAAVIVFAVSFSFDHKSSFHELPAAQAQSRMPHWPAVVAVADVQAVSYKCESSIDSYSTWYRVTLNPEAAKNWAISAHADRTAWGADSMHNLHSGYESVSRTVTGPPPLHRATGDSPDWWEPPSIDFRATEVMLWYSDQSGVGSATYTAFDEPSQTLWIYEYSCQHDTLWSRGDLPEGETFSGDRDT